MKESEDNMRPQDDLFLVEEKEDAINQFIQAMKNQKVEISEVVSEEVGDKGEIIKTGKRFSLKLRKGHEGSKKKLNESWNNMVKKVKSLSPSFQRYRKIINRLDGIKSDTEEIKVDIDQLSFLIVQLMDKQEHLEDYLKENLGSDWKKFQYTYQKYQDGEISKWDLAKAGVSKLGKLFINIFI
ncbi:MAG: hypothetical protein ACW99E_20075 [Promethearchaeota archaeon]|jgi:hypothetical protein